MKVEFIGAYGCWWWSARIAGSIHSSPRCYSRRRDAVRGFERFCAAIKKAGRV